MPTKLVAHMLSTHMNAEGGSCRPSIPTLAREASLSVRAVRAALRELEEAGFVGTVTGGGRASGGGYASNSYRATLPSPASPAGL
ncbi:MAG: helix-turn-helix domain-containing protein [Gaiellaceae bacterium]